LYETLDVSMLVRSQQTWAKANKEGWFKDEIEPVEVKAKKGTVMVRPNK
jgi:acetyl-CoA acetyltransferase